MRKISLAVALVAAFAVTGCASMGGGYVGSKPYPGPLGDVLAGNLALTCPGDVFIGPPINRCLRHIGGGVGRYTNYPMYWGGSSGLRLSDADKVALMCGIGTGATATLSGASVRTVLASGVLGYVACRAIGMVASQGNRGDNDEMTVVVPPADEAGRPQTPSGRENGWNERLREQRYGSQPQLAPVELEWQMLRNEFNGVTIYARVQGLDPSQPIVIPAGQTETVQIPRGAQIWAEALICLDESCTVQRWRQDVGRRPLPQGAGWVFYNLEEGR